MLIAVIDTDVLFPMLLRDTVLRAAAAGCFRIHWSDRSLDEMARNLIADYGMAPGKAAALRTVMCEAFPEASVTGWEGIEAHMPNHPKDRHVAAAAVAIGATCIVTSNTRDFVSLPAGIVAMGPDRFLCELFAMMPDRLLAALHAQVSAYHRPTLSVVQLLDRLHSVVPDFARRALLAVEPPGGLLPK